MRTFALFYVVVLLTLHPAAPLAAQDQAYQIDRYEVDLRLDGNGRYQIEERLSFSFSEGTFSQGFRSLPTRRLDGIANVQVESPNTSIQNVEHGQEGRDYVIRWSYPERSAPITFVLSYVVEGALLEDGERNVIDWDAVGDEWDVPIQDVHIAVTLPSFGLEAADITAEPTDDGSLRQTAAGWTASFSREEIPARTPYRILISFPHQMEGRAPGGLPPGSMLWLIAGALFGLLPAVWVGVQRGRENEASGPETANGAPAEPDLPLSEAYLLLHGSMTTAHRAFRAVLVDLAMGGHLTLRRVTKSSWMGEQEEVEVDVHPLDDPSLNAFEVAFLEQLEKRETLGEFDRRDSGFRYRQMKAMRERLVADDFWRDHRTQSNQLLVSGFMLVVIGIALAMLLSGTTAIFVAALCISGGVGAALLGTRRYSLAGHGRRQKSEIEAYLSDLRTSIESLLPEEPARALRQFVDHLPWLVLDPDMDKAWLENLQDAVEAAGGDLPLPAWFEDLTGKEGEEDAMIASFLPFIVIMTQGSSSGAGVSTGAGAGMGASGGVGGGGGGVS